MAEDPILGKLAKELPPDTDVSALAVLWPEESAPCAVVLCKGCNTRFKVQGNYWIRVGRHLISNAGKACAGKAAALSKQQGLFFKAFTTATCVSPFAKDTAVASARTIALGVVAAHDCRGWQHGFNSAQRAVATSGTAGASWWPEQTTSGSHVLRSMACKKISDLRHDGKGVVRVPDQCCSVSGKNVNHVHEIS